MSEVRTEPEHATLLCDFANTYDYEDQIEGLARPADLTTWLRKHALLDRSTHPSTHTSTHTARTAGASVADLEFAIRLRDGIRQAMLDHHETRSDGHTPDLDRAARELPLRVEFTVTGPQLRPVDTGVRGGLAQLMVAVVRAEADGIWSRLKLCPADDCRWAFYDGSKNRSRQWCSMGVCGNRQKTRNYRERQRKSSNA